MASVRFFLGVLGKGENLIPRLWLATMPLSALPPSPFGDPRTKNLEPVAYVRWRRRHVVEPELCGESYFKEDNNVSAEEARAEGVDSIFSRGR
jgi:hypothetical protein